ncbi:MAG: DUF3794 domain-containing protein [Patescibacteria group bacterium]
MNAQALLGEVTTQLLVANTTTLGVPAVKIDEIVATVNNLSCTVIPGKVIFQGNVHKQIFFVDIEGIVRHQAEDIPFSGFIDFPGAAEGTPCQLEPVIEFIDFRLAVPVTLRQTIVLSITARLFDPPPGEFFLNTAPAGADRFCDRRAFRTGGLGSETRRTYRARLGI